MCENNTKNIEKLQEINKPEKFLSEGEAKWYEKYGILKQFDEICYQEAERLFGMTKEEFSELLERRRLREQKYRKPKLFFDDLITNSTKPMPQTSSAMVGWRSARRECTLEYFGQLYRSRRFTIHPVGVERDPPENQKFIILG